MYILSYALLQPSLLVKNTLSILRFDCSAKSRCSRKHCIHSAKGTRGKEDEWRWWEERGAVRLDGRTGFIVTLLDEWQEKKRHNTCWISCSTWCIWVEEMSPPSLITMSPLLLVFPDLTSPPQPGFSVAFPPPLPSDSSFILVLLPDPCCSFAAASTDPGPEAPSPRKFCSRLSNRSCSTRWITHIVGADSPLTRKWIDGFLYQFDQYETLYCRVKWLGP